MKICIISDTHNQHKKLNITECDVLIHCGDATPFGEEHQLFKFFAWMSEQPAKHKVFVAGNHDFDVEHRTAFWKEHCSSLGIILLQNEAATIAGLKMYGTADQPMFCDWAFNRNGTQLEMSYAQIPEGLDILITHCPPYGLLDMVHFANGDPKMRVGSMHLYTEVMRAAPKIHCFGHIHSDYGYKEFNGTKFYNAALCDEMNSLSHEPWSFEI